MATMTAPIRGTPSLSVAPTQNTAPVFEYRCLYTHDLRKKKKIWHDGSLRFHTFNRRVMVYDDAKNYIGDHHYRESDQLNDGDELRLDKGVLVEVGEQIGRTETDLAPLFEKSHPQKSTSPPRAPLRQLPSTSIAKGAPPSSSSSSSSAQPRSLAEVLGASQGPIGRARLPVQSPYEQRQQTLTSIHGVDDRPSKKRKLDEGKENRGPQERSKLAGKSKIEVAGAKTLHISTLHGQTQQNRPNSERKRDVNKVCSDYNTEPQSSDAFTVEALDHQINRSSLKTSNLPQVPAPRPAGAQTLSPLRHEGQIDRPRSPRHTATTPSTNFHRASSPNVTSSKTTCSENPKPSAKQKSGRLCFAPSKPRAKLLYPTLLAARSSGSTARKPTEANRIHSVSPPEILLQSPPARASRRAARNIHLDSSSDVDVEDGPPRKSLPSKPDDMTREKIPSPALDTGGSSPLFLPATPPIHNQLESQQTQLLDDLDFSAMGDFDFVALKAPAPPTQTPHDIVDHPMGSIGPDSKNHVSPPSKLTMMDQQLLAPIPPRTPPDLCNVSPPAPAPAPPPETTKLRRTHSENDAEIAAETFPRDSQAIDATLSPLKEKEPQQQQHEPEQPESLNLLAPPQRQKPFKPHAPLRKLQKSISDSAASALNPLRTNGAAIPPRPLVRTTSANSNASSDGQDADLDQGPWSKAEAFDLFESWPEGMGREKPVYGCSYGDGYGDGNGDTEENEKEPDARPLKHRGGRGRSVGGFISDQLDHL